MNFKDKIIELIESTNIDQKYIDYLLTIDSLFDKMVRYQIIELDGNDIQFTKLGDWLFNKKEFASLYYFENLYLYTKPNQRYYPFAEIIDIGQLFNVLVPKFDSRDNLIREEIPVIEQKTFMSALAGIISSTNIYSNPIRIEQDDDNKTFTISAKHDLSQRKDSINLVNFMCSIRLFNWHFRQIVGNGVHLGIIRRDIDNKTISYKILYKNAAITFDTSINITEKKILDYIQNNSKVTRKDIVYNLNISPRNASRLLEFLVNKGCLNRIGEKGNKNSFYTSK